MNKRIKRQWVDALRSGKFKQGKGALCKVELDGVLTHCCLGVLCELAVEAGVTTAIQDRSRRRFDYGTYVLPEVVSEWAGLDRVDPYISETGTAADHNDNGDSFFRIADLIDKTL